MTIVNSISIGALLPHVRIAVRKGDIVDGRLKKGVGREILKRSNGIIPKVLSFLTPSPIIEIKRAIRESDITSLPTKKSARAIALAEIAEQRLSTAKTVNTVSLAEILEDAGVALPEEANIRKLFRLLDVEGRRELFWSLDADEDVRPSGAFACGGPFVLLPSGRRELLRFLDYTQRIELMLTLDPTAKLSLAKILQEEFPGLYRKYISPLIVRFPEV